jgi:putative ABC transport system substrate-binding protein
MARGQQAERLRSISVLMNVDNADNRASYKAFVQTLEQLGWKDGINVRLDSRWAEGRESEIRKHALDMVAAVPDVIVATGTSAIAPLLQATRTLPIVFVNVADPVGAGFIESMARPGGNVTGFVQFEYPLGGKWVELLKQIAPEVQRVAVLRDPTTASGVGLFAVVQSMAPSLAVEATVINVREAGEVERALIGFAQSPNGGLIVTPGALAVSHSELIISLAARHKLPAVYFRRYFVANGGLVSYGYDIVQQYRGVAGYVDRILKGAKPADLPVQAPTKYQLAINLKTAKALGIEIPPTLLARADEVIE